MFIMRKFRTSLFVVLMLLICSAAYAQSNPMTAIKAGRLINPADGSVIQNALIIIRGDRIESVTTGSLPKLPDGTRVIDLSGFTVLPGLIDCHTHVMLQPEDERGAPPVITKSQAFRTV